VKGVVLQGGLGKIILIMLTRLWHSVCVARGVLVRFDFPISVKTTMLLILVVTLCGLVCRYQRFGETHCLHLQY
jgi:hypothetical protein